MSVERVQRIFENALHLLNNYLWKKYLVGNGPLAAAQRGGLQRQRYPANLDSKHFPKWFLTTS